MLLRIDGETQIRGTDRCWQIEQKRKRKGADEWCALSYHATFGDALGAACRREIRTHPATTLAESIAAAEAVATRYGRLLDKSVCR